jgi:ubiquinone/menaquinone biosynthesis C-methylase UbiE
MSNYIHGYTELETIRLNEQSVILEDLIHSGTKYKKDELILEAGCGVGAQSIILARRNPLSKFIGIDRSAESIETAKKNLSDAGYNNFTFLVSDIFEMNFEAESFDHIFICFVLEHLSNPLLALSLLKKILKKGGSITIIEGDHDSCIWNPYTEKSKNVWQAMIKAQQRINHDPLIGRKLYPLLTEAGFKVQMVEPRFVYADSNNIQLLDGVVNKIIVPMVKTTKNMVVGKLIKSEALWQQGINDLEKSAITPCGTFFYSWFKALAYKLT